MLISDWSSDVCSADLYWSVIPPLLAIYWFTTRAPGIDMTRAVLVIALVWYWTIRLTANWATFWTGLQHEDWRYPLVRERAGKFAAAADFAGIPLFQTIQVFLGCLPIYAVLTRGHAQLGGVEKI